MMIFQELTRRAQIYKYLSKYYATCSPIDERDSDVSFSKSHQPKSTYYVVSKKFSESSDKWIVEYDLASRNPKWVYEILRRSSIVSSENANRKKSKFFAEAIIPDNFKVIHLYTTYYLLSTVVCYPFDLFINSS